MVLPLFKWGFDSGFDAVFQHRAQEIDTPLLHLNDQINVLVPPEKARRSSSLPGHSIVDMHHWTNRYFQCEEETFARRTAATTVRWLEENWKINPFFLWVDSFDPHEPWDPPEYMVRRYDPDYGGTPVALVVAAAVEEQQCWKRAVTLGNVRVQAQLFPVNFPVKNGQLGRNLWIEQLALPF